MTKEQAKIFFGRDLEPGTYEVVYRITGGLVVGGFDSIGNPLPGVQKILSEGKFTVEVEGD